nr:tectonin domain-containing protein [Streptomyces sp. SID7805]
MHRSRRRDTNMADWLQVSGGLTTISVGSRTHVWGVNSLGQIYRIYRYTGDQGPTPWVNISGGLTRISVPGKAVDIGVAADGTVWHVNADGGIYRYTGDQPS